MTNPAHAQGGLAKIMSGSLNPYYASPRHMGDLKKISSRNTFILKRVFPIVWVGSLTAMGALEIRRDLSIVIPILLMGLFGFVMMKMLVWNLADQVHDGGDFLLVKFRGVEETVPLSNVMNVNYNIIGQSPPRVVLRLVEPCRFGNEIAFMPELSLNLKHLRRNPVVEDLIIRMDRARRLPQ